MIDKSTTKMASRRYEATSWLGSTYRGYGAKGFIQPPKWNRPGVRGGYGMTGFVIPPGYRKQS